MKASKPFVEVKHEVHTEIREPTDHEIYEAELLKTSIKKMEELRDAAQRQVHAAEEQLRKMKLECKHTVSVDIFGFPYDSRQCYSCGADQGLV